MFNLRITFFIVGIDADDEKNKDIKIKLIVIIGTSGSRVAVKPLIEELKNPDEEIRDAAVAMLSNFKFADAVEAVEKYNKERQSKSS